LAKLRDGLPDIAFDAPPATPDEAPDLTAASPQQVFFHAVLKRFQRDNRALQTLDDSGIGRLAALAENRNFGDGERIILQGDPGDGFYLLVEGQVKVTLEEKGDKEVARIAAGGFFGEMAMLKDQRRSASVWSIGQTTTLYFSKDLVLPFLHETPAMREVLSGVALKRTEENLWRVLFDDDEVQRSMANLGDSLGDALEEQDKEVDPVLAAAPAPVAPKPVAKAVNASNFTKTITPAAVLLTPEEAAKQKTLSDIMRERSFLYGVAAGFLGGIIATLLIDAMRAPPSAPEPQAPVAIVQPQVKPASMPASLPASAPASMAASAPVEEDEPVVAKKPKAPEGANPERDLLAEAYKAGNYKQVLSSAKKLPQPLTGDAGFMFCDAQRQTGVPSALQCYLDFATAEPKHGKTDDAQFWAAELLVQQGKAADARALYEKVAANEKSNFRNSAAKRLEH
jgi:CRP-like cAMP-binding protein